MMTVLTTEREAYTPGLRLRLQPRPSHHTRPSFLGLDDGPSHIKTAFRADHMRRHRRAALAAIGQLPRFLGVMSPAAPRLGIRLSSLRNSHAESRSAKGPSRATA